MPAPAPGKYDPEILAQIKQQGGSAIYLMLSPNKARAASAGFVT